MAQSLLTATPPRCKHLKTRSDLPSNGNRTGVK